MQPSDAYLAACGHHICDVSMALAGTEEEGGGQGLTSFWRWRGSV
jgi:hypothetical protein